MKNEHLAILFVSHGSRSAKAKKEIQRLARSLKKCCQAPIFHYAFLDVNQPDIPTGIKMCIEDGAEKIVVLLNFLNSGDHAVYDIPRLICETTRKFPYVKFQLTPPIGRHPKIRDIFLDLLKKASAVRCK